jgi:O-methyltransferase
MNDSEIEIVFGGAFFELWSKVRPYTMVSPQRGHATYNACDYVCRNNIPGDFAECGVFRGGMALLAALVFSSHGQTHRNVWLFDTFKGMSEPTDQDVDRQGLSAAALMADFGGPVCAAGLAEVQANLAPAGYPNVRFIEGDVLQTLRQPANLPDRLAVLRLDTDWYESTKTELDALYPRLSSHGVVLVDDYGHWLGARKAVDEFVVASPIPLYLTRTDTTGVEFIKPV